MDTRIYIMTHKKFDVPQKQGYFPLQVGREGKEDLGYLCDNEGEHISGKNASYCELTGLYWMWKNVRCDIAGLCHYRRYFIKQEEAQCDSRLEEKLLDCEYIEKCLQHYDIIVPNSGMSRERSVKEHYQIRHHIADLQICGAVLREKYPEDYPAFEWSLSTNLISLGNMVIAPKPILDRYCEWLFDILSEVENRIDISDYDDYQKRVFGFLAERLFRVWLLNRQLKIREEQILFLE